jgi:isopentenyl phosphate kinase
LSGSAATDVTGGMASKVFQSLALVEAIPGLEVLIFSGEQEREVREVLKGESRGTAIRAKPLLPA